MIIDFLIIILRKDNGGIVFKKGKSKNIVCEYVGYHGLAFMFR